MEEVQGPTPAGTSRPYRNLAEALRAHRIDPANHGFITAIVDAVGVTSFIDRGRYIEAIRRGEGAPLHIGKTYTNGFTAEEVVVVGSAPVRMRPSEGRQPYYYVTHPSEFRPLGAPARRSAARRAAPSKPAAAAPAERDYGTCDVCFMQRTPAGTCAC